jgi:trimethylamine--corrinoid protein Co-methyltransferase
MTDLNNEDGVAATSGTTEGFEVPVRSGRRSGGRAARQAARSEATAETRAYLTRTMAPFEVLSTEGLEIIEHAADTILEEIGIDFRDYPTALTLMADAGADVDGERVRFPRGMCRQIIQASAPPTYTQHGRNPARNVQVGGNATVLAPAYGSPFVHDLDEGRRYATIGDFQNFVKLAYLHPGLHHSGGTIVEPVDIPVSKRHLDMVYSHLKYSDKPFMGSVTAAERAQDSIDLAGFVFGTDFVQQNTVMTSLINASSPMSWDATMLGSAEA